MDFSGIDTLSFAPHKFGGIYGSGVLLKRSRMPLEPQMNGGASTTLYRSGTPALGLAASSALALQLACDERESRCAVVQRHSERLRKALAAYPAVHINSPEHTVPHILNLSVKNVKGTVFQRRCPKKACAYRSNPPARQTVCRPGQCLLCSRDRQKCTVLMAHQPEPPYHGRGNRRISVRFRPCYHELVK